LFNCKNKKGDASWTEEIVCRCAVIPMSKKCKKKFNKKLQNLPIHPKNEFKALRTSLNFADYFYFRMHLELLLFDFCRPSEWT
jgi:hypothetical protein